MPNTNAHGCRTGRDRAKARMFRGGKKEIRDGLLVLSGGKKNSRGR